MKGGVLLWLRVTDVIRTEENEDLFFDKVHRLQCFLEILTETYDKLPEGEKGRVFMIRKDRQVVLRFIEHLKNQGYNISDVTRFPDEDNRTTPDIDAIVNDYAIEHTSVDSLKNQRACDDWFLRVVDGLEEECLYAINFHLRISFSFLAIQKGQNWKEMRKILKDWIINNCSSLPQGSTEIVLDGFPSTITAIRDEMRPPKLLFVRLVSDERNDISKQLWNKVDKLASYKNDDYKTILLVESEDIALMNHKKMSKYVSEAFNGTLPETIDEIWYADTSISENTTFYNIHHLINL